MKRIMLMMASCLIALVSFSQGPKTNGTIYITHPYIDAVVNSTKAYEANNMESAKKFFADTAKFWVSGLEKEVPINEALKMWARDFEYYKDIKMVTVGYPDFLHYLDQDQQFVQSWWRWEGTSKKTGKVLKIDCVQFDKFDASGKISSENIYGDFSQMAKN